MSLGHLERITSELDVPVQYGGGLRDADGALVALAAGAARVVIGTAAFKDVAVLDRLLGEVPERVAVAVDVRGGRVATGGWTERTDLEAEAAVARLAERGVSCFVYTDVDRDGMLGGVDQGPIERVAAAAGGRALIYSGGIGAAVDLSAIAALGLSNLEGVIVGKALYEGRFSVAEGRAALGNSETEG